MIHWFNEYIASPSIQRLGWCLIHSIWQIGLISITAILVMALVSSLRVTRRSFVRYHVAIAGLTMCIALPFATWFFIDVSQPTLIEATPTVALEKIELDFVLENAALAQASEPVGSSTIQENFVSAVQPWIPTLTAVWIIGVLLFSLRPMIGLRTIWRLERTGRLPIDKASQCILERLVDSMNVRRSVQIAESSLARVPMVVGFFKPLILIPASSVIGLSSSELEAVIAHELAHLKRYDDVVNLLQTGIETVLFYHPCVWWLSTVARVERENCCDDIAVSTCGDPGALAKALLALEQTQHVQPALASNGGSLVKRVRRLKEINMTRKNVFQRFSSTIFLVTTVLISIVVVGGFGYSTHLEAQELVQQVDDDKSEKTDRRAIQEELRGGAEADRRIWNILRNEQVKGEYTGTVAEAIDQLSQQVGVNIVFDDLALAAENVRKDQLVDMQIRHPISLSSALQLMIQSAGLVFVVENGSIKITSAASAIEDDKPETEKLRKTIEQILDGKSTQKDRDETTGSVKNPATVANQVYEKLRGQKPNANSGQAETDKGMIKVPNLTGEVTLRVNETGIIVYGDKNDVDVVKEFVDEVILLDSRNVPAASEKQDRGQEGPGRPTSTKDLKQAILNIEGLKRSLAFSENEETGTMIIKGDKKEVEEARKFINEKLLKSPGSRKIPVARVQLKHRPAKEMAEIVQQLIEGTDGMGALQIIPNEPNNTMFLIGQPSGIGYAKTLIETLDVGVEKRVRQREQKNANVTPDMEPFFRVYRLNHCSPELANDVIRTLVKQRKDMVNTRIDTDNKKGQLFIYGPESAHKQVAKVLKTIDIAQEGESK